MAERDDRIVQLRIDLLGFKPPIWRRVQVPAAFALDRLHETIQALFAWENSHLHQFEVGDRYFCPAEMLETMDDIPARPEADVDLAGLVRQKVKRFAYVYDFGDDWEHQIQVEKLLDPEPGVAYPRLVGGRRAAPPEDCGGPPGYDALVEAMQNPEDPDHEDMLDWLGGAPFDPAHFDRDTIERRLHRLRPRSR
jgi:hypothetical protein